MKGVQRILITVVAASLGLIPPLQAAPDDVDLRSLTAEWWQWALSIPASENPVADPTGAKCVVGQRGPVWFLAGSFGETVTRTCSVPAGKVLFFPVANGSFFDSPGLCGQGASISVPEARAGLAAFIGGLTDLAVEVNGKAVGMQRIRSRVFTVALPEDNLFDAVCAADGGMPAGIYAPAVDDGYYVRLKPLKPGNHTLHFHAENAEVGFAIDTTYHLTVVP